MVIAFASDNFVQLPLIPQSGGRGHDVSDRTPLVHQNYIAYLDTSICLAMMQYTTRAEVYMRSMRAEAHAVLRVAWRNAEVAGLESEQSKGIVCRDGAAEFSTT